ncbi:nucleotide exchange factor GrpE [Corallococcus sp. H22C18031201]|uniref:nucleotide exchange factor GrpE n=1 Tax=Citreicoccus inhibens TaxID=2849499 RepID=UPI000E73E617|nr:nucleotide exchange factor GrpE [Citreicoccus inhibens]MBU8898978.1 nucleotide exchange factor GrpE [Citreicoccus inhibens]RJS18446.1 nucleotide exchange factor GrpE [Corallococcus sp. H22C18031201]
MRAVAGSNEKGSIQADIGQDVIDDAVRSVERRMDEGEEVVTQVEVEAAEASSEPVAAPPESQTQVEDATALRQELESVRAQLELSMAKGRETMERLREAHERAKDFQDRALRAAADLENFRKRTVKEKEEIQKFGVEKLLKDLLPVMDNMDRALDAAARSPDIDSFQKGVAMTRKSFEDALGKHGVKAFSAKGQPFDPRLHEAVQQVETAEVPAGHVVMELVRGFFLNERLARPALVVVARAPAEAPEPPAQPAASEQSSGGSQ